MNFKSLLNREFLVSEEIKSKDLTIFYKFDINIKKIEQDAQAPVDTSISNAQAPADLNQNPSSGNTMDQNVVVPPEETTGQEITPETPVETPPVEAPPEMPQSNINPGSKVFSVVTEGDKDQIKVNDDNTIVRKIEGEVKIGNNKSDTIQSMQDIIDILVDEKKDGINILDDFTSQMLNLLLTPNAQQINQQVDKSSSIFAEILYGYKKDDSIGARIIKRKNSDSVTMSMLLDNELINAPATLDKIDQKIVEYRNQSQNKNS